MNALLEFLKEHQELAKGLTRGRRGKLHTLKLWNLCAKELNTCKDGAVKDGKGWSKYWCDWKYRVRRRALELKAARESNKPPPDGITHLSPMEESILGIIGENAVEGVVIKCDPLGEEGTLEEPNDDNHNDDASFNQYPVAEPRQTRSRKRRHSSRQGSDMIDADSHGELSSPTERKPRVSAGNACDSDNDDDATKFLQLERQKLDNSRSIKDSLQTIACEMTRLTDIMSHIRDVLINRINI
ncbi:uncharacterized protein [Epargyreus clarus]